MDTETRMESQPTRHSQLIKIKSGDEISLTSSLSWGLPMLAFVKKKLRQRSVEDNYNANAKVQEDLGLEKILLAL